MAERDLTEADKEKIKSQLNCLNQAMRTGLLTPLNPEGEILRKDGFNKLITDSLKRRYDMNLLDEEAYHTGILRITDFFSSFALKPPTAWSLNLQYLWWDKNVPRPQDVQLVCANYSLFGLPQPSKRELRGTFKAYLGRLEIVWDQIKEFEETTQTFSSLFSRVPEADLLAAENQPGIKFRDPNTIGTSQPSTWKQPFFRNQPGYRNLYPGSLGRERREL